MAAKDEFVEHLLELLESCGNVSARKMFGGYGIYRDGLMFGLVADSTLYLKTDDTNLAEFQARGLDFFEYNKKGKMMKMSYCESPAEALDDPQEMLHWAESAYGAALRAAAKKRRKGE